MQTLPDLNGDTPAIPYARRWLVQWNTNRPGHGINVEACEDHDFGVCHDCHARAFPTQGLARAFARRKLEDPALWYPVVRIVGERFEPADIPAGWGSWEAFDHAEELYRGAPK